MQRKRYSQEFKDQIVKESLEVGNAAIVARKNDLSANMVSRWVREHKNQNNIGIGAVPVRIGSYIKVPKHWNLKMRNLKSYWAKKTLK
jgi:transposase-like protein